MTRSQNPFVFSFHEFSSKNSGNDKNTDFESVMQFDDFFIQQVRGNKKCPNSLEVYPTKSQCPDSIFATCKIASAKRYSQLKIVK